MSHSTEGPRVGAALGKFDSSGLNERFWQTQRLEKQKFEDLKNLKCSLDL